MRNSLVNCESAGSSRLARVMSFVAFVAVGTVAAPLWVSSPAQAALAGPSNPITGTDMNIYNERVADDINRNIRNLKDAARRCDRRSYNSAASALFLLVRGLETGTISYPKLSSDLDPEKTREASDERNIRRVLDDFRARKSQLFAHCGENRAATGSDTNFSFAVGATVGMGFLKMPTIGAGTVGNPGSETALVESQGTLTGARFKLGRSLPIPSLLPSGLDSLNSLREAQNRAQQFPGLQYQFGSRVNIHAAYGNLRGNATGLEPIGGRISSFTFLAPNPATGTTGVNAGATGQSVKVKSQVHAVDFNINYVQPLAGGLIGDNGFWTLEGSGGFQFSFSRGMQKISAQSLTFPGVSSQTDLRSDDYFAAMRLGAILRSQRGPFYVLFAAWLAPGFFLSHGLAAQDILCNVCGNAADQDFRLSFKDTRRAFGVRTGVNLNAGAFLTDNIVLGLNTNYSFISRMGGYENPVSPTQQPVRYDTNAAHSWGASVRIKFIF